MMQELPRRIAFTLGALLVYRLGTHIPVPGINYLPGISRSFVRLSIFSLNIIPYISVAILVQLVLLVWPRLYARANGGERGRRTIARYTLGLTMILTAFQAFGVAQALQRVPGLVSDPGGLFLVSTTLTLLGGTVFLIWLSEQITVRGIGNGLALILATGIVAELPYAIANTLELGRQGALSGERIALIAILSLAMAGLIVFMELARRNLPVQFVARNLRGRLVPAQSSCLSLKLNNAGMIPAIVAPWAFLPITFLAVAFGGTSPWLTAAFRQFDWGHPGHMICSTLAVILLAFIYTALVVDPERAADSLNEHGGVIPGIMPGEPTAEHLDRVVSRTTFVGAIYLAAIFLIPEVLIAYAQVPFFLGGAPVLIVVCAVLDIERQVRDMSLTKPGGAYS